MPVGLDDSDKLPSLSGVPLCLSILEGLDYQKKGFCRCTKLAPTKEGGYVQLSWGGANKFCVLEELLLWASGVTKVEGFQCSHLCCEPLCLCPEHVCLESSKKNNDRKNCAVFFDCYHCPLKTFICKHDPSCIKYAPGFETWEDFLLSGIHKPLSLS